MAIQEGTWACPLHGLNGYIRQSGETCAYCYRDKVLVPEGTIMVWQEREVVNEKGQRYYQGEGSAEDDFGRSESGQAD